MVYSLFGVNRFKEKLLILIIPPVHNWIAINGLYFIAYLIIIIIIEENCVSLLIMPLHHTTSLKIDLTTS
jgi:hypothetical protein